MSASRAPRSLALLLCLALISALAPASAAASTAVPVPNSMAAVGDSITQAASSGGSLGADYPENSWSTGTNSTVNSHYLRLTALNSAITELNASVSGAKVGGLAAQMATLDVANPDYLTVLIGGNDLCTDTIEEMTSVSDFRGQFQYAMTTLLGDSNTTGVSPDTNVYVVSIPDVHQLWELFRNNFFARAVWSAGNICQSLLENPTSNQQADVDRRAAFRQRNIDYNTQLLEVCAAFTRCHFDGNAVFNGTIERGDVAGDYFHPSVAGQAKLASVSWDAGYTWTSTTTNAPPTASFTYGCTDLTCSFDGSSSSDSDGSIASFSWNFGDTTDPVSGATVSHTYAAGGTYTVTLTVTDDDGATDTTSQSVTVPPADTMRVSDLSGTSVSTGRNTWTATVTITVVDSAGGGVGNANVSGAWSIGTGTTSCVTDAAGQCQMTSDNLNKRKDSQVTFSVTGVTADPLVWDEAGSVTSITVPRP